MRPWPVRFRTLGGVVFGIVGVALPLTMFSGSASSRPCSAMRGRSWQRRFSMVLIAAFLTQVRALQTHPS
jgi:mRNA-degrading endonuclease toxin of MazEF toxin-antitoxin module